MQSVKLYKLCELQSVVEQVKCAICTKVTQCLSHPLDRATLQFPILPEIDG